MAGNKRFDVKNKACRRLADLAGIRGDLNLCVRACDEFLSISSPAPHVPTIIEEALAEFAIFRYCRTISTDVRSGVRLEQVEMLQSDLRESHHYFKDLRDKHLAHSVNHHEQNSVEATVSDDQEATVLKIGTYHSRSPATGYARINSLRQLANGLLKIVLKEYKAESDVIWDLLESMTPQERIALSSKPKSVRRFRPTHAKRPQAGGG